MPSEVDSENDMMEITKFHSSTAVFSVVLKMKVVRKRIAAKHQKTSDQETDKDDTTSMNG
jgi:hypothetical protein